MKAVQLFVVLFFIVIAFLYALINKVGVPFLLPGDVYRNYGGRKLYFPLGTGLILTTLIFLLIKFFM